MQVYEITVRRMRRAQVRDYEPTEAEFSLKAQLGEDDDFEQCGRELMSTARDLVYESIGLKIPVATTVKDEVVEKSKKESPKTKTKAKPAKKAVESDIPDDIPGDDDIPDDIPGDDDIPDEELTLAQKQSAIQDLVSSLVSGRKLTTAKAKAMFKPFGVVRAADLDNEQASELLASLEAIE